MPSALDKKALFLQNLKDAGCSTELTEECLLCYNDGNYEKMLCELSAYRRTVLLETRKKTKANRLSGFFNKQNQKERVLKEVIL